MRSARAEAKSTNQIPSVTFEVQICQTRQACWVYGWDRERGQLRVQGIEPGQDDLPADLAVLHLEQQREVPVFVLTERSLMPGALISVRVLGALQAERSSEREVDPFPLADWTLLTVPDLPGLRPLYETLDQMPPAWMEALRAHVRSQGRQDTRSQEPVLRQVEEVERQVRAARLWLKRERRQSGRTRQKNEWREEEQVVAWRAVEELTPEQRAQIAQARTIEALTPLLQAEQLIRFVPARFQKALERVLLDDERLLAFLERPLLRHRTGLFGLQQYRANAGLFLLTDTQVLWLRDFFSPGASAFPEGFIAHSVPLERLTAVQLLPTHNTRGVTGERQNPSLHVRLSIESSGGCEDLDVAFPDNDVSRKALARMVPLIRAFVPWEAPSERRVRCLPLVEPWFPQGEEARKLSGLGGIVPTEQKQRLENGLAETLQASGEELLASALVPALEQYRSPARLVALTRAAMRIFEIPVAPTRWGRSSPNASSLQVQHYELAQISSAQLSYSLLGSDLRLYLPQPDGTTRERQFPFHSPAAARFLPLFTRLRLLLRAPLLQAQRTVALPRQEETGS